MNKLSEFFSNIRLYLVLMWNVTKGILGNDYSSVLGAFYGIGVTLVNDGYKDLDSEQNNAKSIADKHIVRVGITIINAVRHLLALIMVLIRSNGSSSDIELIIDATRTWEFELEESILITNELKDMLV